MNSILDDVDDGSQPSPRGTELNWSDNQQAVFQAVADPRQNILIQAVAGSGKSTTLIEAMNRVWGSALFMAFNKAIAEDIRGKAQSGDVKTLNALGHGILMNNRGGELNARKTSDVLKTQINDQEFLKEHGYTLSRAVGLAKNLGFGLSGKGEGPEEFVDLLDAYLDVNSDQLGQFSELAYGAFVKSRADEKTFDFDDQLYQPLYNQWHFPTYSNVFVDECQDLSPVQHLMVGRLAAEGARIVAVGDRHQALYGFRGAMTDSMDRLAKQFNMLELPLDISYRCAESVVKEAQFYNPAIQARTGAPEGSVKRLDYGDRDPDLFSNALVLCRNNAPLFRAILKHVRARSPCRVLSNFLESFQGFVRGFKTTYTTELRDKLDLWYAREKAEATKRGFKGKLAALQDKYETCKLLCAEHQRTEDVIWLVKRLGEGTSGPTFATVHKAKGLEHENVWVLRPDLMPAQYATSEDQKQQESNLIYVAITRAKENLTWGEQAY